MARVERQELHCHECGEYVQFDLDLEMDGNHVLACPSCGHEHCRVVNKGVISDTRWDQRNKPVPPLPPGSVPVNNVVPPTQIIAPNGLPVFYVTASTMTCSTQGIGVYRGTTATGNVYLYMNWANSAAKTWTA